MDPSVWQGLYDEICLDFGYDKEKDLECARLLAGLLAGRSERALAEVREGFPESVLICGGGPNLQAEISSTQLEGYVVAADSAASVLLESGVAPDMIVTDLDGIVEDQLELNARGSVVFVHAHGDNLAAIKRHVPDFRGRVVGTCQCLPPPSVFNFGGFTDGDRAACICAALGASDIVLMGFDFEAPSEKPGKRRDVKKRKLQWARKIIDHLSSEGVRIEMSRDRAVQR
ncbi:MAG: DUF115 domain-containing protein [Candidatus Thermoplasmatota archaeon]|nr:DUF115 domain-containing protein [Candidatus Thermoplasmatota archaeon]